MIDKPDIFKCTDCGAPAMAVYPGSAPQGVMVGNRRVLVSSGESSALLVFESLEAEVWKLGLVHPGAGMKKRTAGRRFESHTPIKADARGLSEHNAALTENRTIFPSTVVDSKDSPRLLVSGHNQRKIGKHVTKGRWADMPIFCLTLEERATCPSSCHHWRDCYGNNMHMARRHRHGPDLERRLIVELATMQSEYPGGFVVRLHVLGDFLR